MLCRACDWHWYYVDNAFSLQGLQRFADALTEFDPQAGRKYREEAEAFRKDLRRAVEREAALAPVRLGRDGTYHSYIPKNGVRPRPDRSGVGRAPVSGLRSLCGALPLAEPFARLDANDVRMVDTAQRDGGDGNLGRRRARNWRKRGRRRAFPPTTPGSGIATCMLPKASHNANIFLLQDDVPNFLRFWMNSYAAMVGANGQAVGSLALGRYADCTAPDNGTAGWFMENFRNLLVMEDGQSLWLARATPRVWLEQGKKIAVKNAPTYFGTLAYEIVSDVDHGKITATVEIPSRNPPKSVVVRFRHPKAAPIKSAMVNGKPWSDFDPAKEIVRLRDACAVPSRWRRSIDIPVQAEVPTMPNNLLGKIALATGGNGGSAAPSPSPWPMPVPTWP